MRRREFITLLGGAASVWPLGAGAQQSGTKRIGVLVLGDSTSAPFLEGLQSGLRHLGYSEGRDIQFEVRSARGHAEDLAALAAELVRLNVDVIVAYATSAATAAKQATKDIPIVMYVADPVATGLINSFARPGGNITGVSIAMSETGAKNLELIHELLPSARRVAVLLNATEQSHEPLLDHIQAGAGPMKVEIKPTLVRSNDELEGDFADIADRARRQPTTDHDEHDGAIQAAKRLVVGKMNVRDHGGGPLSSYLTGRNPIYSANDPIGIKVHATVCPALLPPQHLR